MQLSAYTFEALRRDGEFILYRGDHRRQTDASPPSTLAMTPVLERPALASLRRMEHEYSFKAELDPGWAARPLALASHEGRTMLVLTDPGGEPLDRLLEEPMESPCHQRLTADRFAEPVCPADASSFMVAGPLWTARDRSIEIRLSGIARIRYATPAYV
jgi:hypothetical protein